MRNNIKQTEEATISNNNEEWEMPDKETWVMVKSNKRKPSNQENCSCCIKEKNEDGSRDQNRWQTLQDQDQNQDQDQDQTSGEGQDTLQPCTLTKPACMNTVESKDGWTKLRFRVGSGAHDFVMPPEERPQIPTRESKRSRFC